VIERSGDSRKSLAEVLSIARSEMRAAIGLDSDTGVTVKFELELPLRTVRQFRNGEAQHRCKETGIHGWHLRTIQLWALDR
jgi:hypothetical protein